MPTQTAPEPPATLVDATSELTYELEERFNRSARIDAKSDEKSATSPSTQSQYELLRLLVDELTSSGAHDAKLTEYGAALATIPASMKTDAPAIAILKYVDTAAVRWYRRQTNSIGPIPDLSEGMQNIHGRMRDLTCRT